jgi:FkbM family methyltransferase
MNSTERLVKKIFQKSGVLIRKYNPATSEELRRTRLFKHHGVNMVFDVGANRGQYSRGIIDAGYKGKIVSFEPLSSVHTILENEARAFPQWEVAPRCAIGSANETIEINISANSVSSTLLNMLDSHYDGAPDSKIIGKEKVQVFPLDGIAPRFINEESKLFIKIDVQGFEQEVMKGAEKTLESAIGVELEISLVPLYEKQSWLLIDVLQFMDRKGFTLSSIVPAFTNHQSGEVLQCNGIFFRKKK